MQREHTKRLSVRNSLLNAGLLLNHGSNPEVAARQRNSTGNNLSIQSTEEKQCIPLGATHSQHFRSNHFIFLFSLGSYITRGNLSEAASGGETGVKLEHKEGF